MYNTQFKVKYNEIEDELLHKLKDKTPEEYVENPDEEHEYSSQDVLDICNKLYRDELLSVFGAEDLSDDNIDKGMLYVFENMMMNDNFKEIINEMETILINSFLKTEEVTPEKQDSLKYLLLLTLFSQHLFHITHKCICQQIETGIIHNDLLIQLRKHSSDIVKNQFG